MRIPIALICLLAVTACVSTNQETRSFQAINLDQNKGSKSDKGILVEQFSNLCIRKAHNAKSLIETAQTGEWQPASQKSLSNEGLAKLKKTTLIIPGGGSPVEESQNIFAKSFEGQNIFLVVSERFDRKKLTTTTCTLYGKQDEFLKNCSDLGILINRAPDQNTKYEKSNAQFISWKAAISQKRARINCQHTPQSPTLPYEGTILAASVDHITLIRSVDTKKSSQQRFDVSEQ